MRSSQLAVAALLALVAAASARPDDREGRREYEYDDDDDKPYSFAWEASRHYLGAPDREHREERGDDGVTRGVYRYVDPSLKVQEVIYVADQNGFRVESNNQPEYTPEQEAARRAHEALFRQIAEEHSRIGAEHVQSAIARGDEPYVEPLSYSGTGVPPSLDDIPQPEFSEAVLRARAAHQALFNKIAEQHARIAAERPNNPEDEETGEPYH